MVGFRGRVMSVARVLVEHRTAFQPRLLKAEDDAG
jgi:hypothetical protein